VSGFAAAVGEVSVSLGLLVVAGLLITVARRLIAVGKRLLVVCERLTSVAQALIGEVRTLFPIRERSFIATRPLTAGRELPNGNYRDTTDTKA